MKSGRGGRRKGAGCAKKPARQLRVRLQISMPAEMAERLRKIKNYSRFIRELLERAWEEGK